MRWLLRVMVLVVLAAGAGGCVNAHAEIPTIAERPSVGRQLMDLKAARDRGDISEQQYQRARQDIINSAYAK